WCLRVLMGLLLTCRLGHRLLHPFPTRRSSDLQRRRAFLLTGAVIIMACLEVANVSAIGPFLALATDPSMVEQNVVLSFLYQRFEDRKSTRLNSSHVKSSYAVFCLKKKNTSVHR